MDTDSRAAGALLARARTLHLQTGNLLNWGRLQKKCPSTHSEEVRTGGRALPAETRGCRARPRTRPGGCERPGRVVGPGAHLGSPGGRKLGCCRRCITPKAAVGVTGPLKNLAGAASQRVTPVSVLMAAIQTLGRFGSVSLARSPRGPVHLSVPVPSPHVSRCKIVQTLVFRGFRWSSNDPLSF